ncbi:hypothetical protein D3C73_895780 [compost metagenome]
MPKNTGKIHAEKIAVFRKFVNSYNRANQNDQPRNNMRQVHPDKNVNKRLRCIVIHKINTPIDQYIPSMNLQGKKYNSQNKSCYQKQPLFGRLAIFSRSMC